MQPSPSTTLPPAIALMEKTPQVLETMLGGIAPDADHRSRKFKLFAFIGTLDDQHARHVPD